MSSRQVQLNQELARKTLAADVLAIVRDSVDEFNLVNCGTALQRLAKCPDTHRLLSPTSSALPGVPRVLQEQFARLLDAAARLVSKDPRHVESRQLASMLWACGKLELGHRAADLVEGIETAAIMHASKFNPQELANAIWGAAKLGLDPSRSELVRAVADAIAVSLSRASAAPGGPQRDPKGGGPGGWRANAPREWTPQGISNVAMSLAKLDADVTHGEGVSTTGGGFKYGRVFGEVCAAAKARAEDFNPQEVANILHALAKLTAGDGEGDGGGGTIVGPVERTAREATEALASRITRRWIEAQRLEPQHVANMSWACAKMGAAGGDDLAGALATAAANLAPRMNTQELSMVAWSAAAFGSGRWPADCAETVARAFGNRASEATPRQLAKAAMAYAKLGTLHPRLMDAVANAVLALEQPFASALNPQDVANLAWSFSKLGFKKKRLFDAISAAFVAHLGEDEARFSSQQLTMIVCAFGLLDFKDESMLNAAMGAMSKERVAEFNPRDLTNTSWALAALGVNAEAKPDLVERIGRTARRRLDDFNSQELLKFLGAFERLGGKDSKLAKAVSKQRTLSYEFPALSTHAESSFVKLSSKTPTSYQGTDRVRVDDSCGGWGRGNTGVALWEGSFVLAEWLSRQSTPTGSDEMAEVMRGAWGPNESGGWRGMTGVELGAGLGLPSIVASKLGLEMVATDGDDDVLELLSQNIETNTSPEAKARVSRLVWGCDEPLEHLGLSEPPKLILASDVVYGNDPQKWKLLVKTMCDLSGPSTLVVIGNVQRYPVHHPMAETKFFSEATARDFERTEVPVTSLHPDFRRTGGGACVIHLFRRRPESLKRSRSDSDVSERKVKKSKKEKKGKKEKSSKKEKKSSKKERK